MCNIVFVLFFACKVGIKTTFNKTHCICKVGGELGNSESSESHSRQAHSTQKLNQPERVKKKKITRATFAGGFFVAPNPIDFSKAFAGFANLAENPVAFATVLSILGLYLILLFWARREDRKDIEKVCCVILL